MRVPVWVEACWILRKPVLVLLWGLVSVPALAVTFWEIVTPTWWPHIGFPEALFVPSMVNAVAFAILAPTLQKKFLLEI